MLATLFALAGIAWAVILLYRYGTKDGNERIAAWLIFPHNSTYMETPRDGYPHKGWALWWAVLSILPTAGVWAVVLAFFAIPWFWQGWDPDTEHRQLKHHIVNIGDTPGNHGELRGLFYVAGSSEGELQLSFYEQGPHGVIRPRTIGNSDGDVRIHNTPAGTKPRVVQHWDHETYTTKPWLQGGVIPPIRFWSDGHYAYDVYVPEGSVKHEFRLDAQ